MTKHGGEQFRAYQYHFPDSAKTHLTLAARFFVNYTESFSRLQVNRHKVTSTLSGRPSGLLVMLPWWRWSSLIKRAT